MRRTTTTRSTGCSRRPWREQAFGYDLLIAGAICMISLLPVSAQAQDPPPRAAASGPARDSGADAAADAAEPSPVPRAEPSAPIATPVVYVPPARGRARHTAGAGTRALAANDVSVAVLAPNDHVALTTRAQPTLYWFVSADTDARIDVTLSEEEGIDPLLEWTVPPPVTSGIHALRLADLGLALEAGKTYRWNVALVADPERRSSDAFAQGFISLTEVSPVLARSLSRARARYAPYALSGIWYDAIDELSAAIEAEPRSALLHRQRVALLEQADLASVAHYVRRESR